MNDSRRNFLRQSAGLGAGALLIPELAKAVVREQKTVKAPGLQLKKDAVILLQGDSITDAGRERENNLSNSLPMLGTGYSLFLAGKLLSSKADRQLKIYNRGVSGNKVYQLRERWEMECLALRPEVVSILIGVNDFWHTLTGGYKATVEVYEEDYRNLLAYTLEKLPGVQLVIGEPFALRGGAAVEDARWFPAFDAYREVARKLAGEFNAVFVPYQAGFEAAIRLASTRYWSYDGVHPDLPGRQLMADLWLEATGLNA